MKRIAGVAFLTVLLLVAVLWSPDPVSTQVRNAVTPAVLQARAWTFAALQTFPAGANVTGGYHRDATSLNVTGGSQVGFEGQSGDTYVKRDADVSSLDAYKDGSIGWSVIGGMFQPPACPADMGAAPPGFCYDTATGVIKMVDASGVRDL
jgi:hypothetical protein